MVLGLSVLDADNLQNKYKSMMNENNQESVNSTFKLAKFISELKSYKKDDFETVEEFDKRMNDKIEFFYRSANSKMQLIVGTVTMKSYNPNIERVTVDIHWNNNIKELFPQTNILTIVHFNFPKDKARKLFSNKKSVPLFMNFLYKNSKILINQLLIGTKDKTKDSKLSDSSKKSKVFLSVYAIHIDNNIMFPVISSSKSRLSNKDLFVDLSWKNAVKYCKELNHFGYTDWRLPKKNESEGSKYCWTSLTKDIPIMGIYAWKNGSFESIDSIGHTICVRDIK